MGSSGGGRVWKLSMVCLHNNAIVGRGILVTTLHCGTSEPRLSATYIVSSVGTLLGGLVIYVQFRISVYNTCTLLVTKTYNINAN